MTPETLPHYLILLRNAVDRMRTLRGAFVR